MKPMIRILSLTALVLSVLFAAFFLARPSNELQVTFPQSGIGTPSAQSATDSAGLSPPVLVATAGSDRITITWQHMEAAASYEIWARQESDEPWTQLDNGALTHDSTSFVHTGLSSGDTYYYTGRAVPSAGAKSGWAAEVQATVTNIPALTAAASAGRIELSWTSVTDADSYQLVVWTDGLTNWQRIGDPITGTITSYTHSGLTELNTYHYRIRAVIGDTTAGWSDSVSEIPVRPAAPTLTATAAVGQIGLTWTAVTGVDSYRLITWTNGQTAWERIGDPISSSTTSYTHSGLVAGKSYYYRISAVKNGIEGAWSDSVNGSPGAPPAPTLTATAAVGQVDLTWTAVTGAGSYHLIVWTEDQNAWVRIGDTISGSATSYTHSGLSAGQTYYHRIGAVVNGTEGVWSNSVSSVPGASFMPGIAATASAGQVQLNWSQVTSADSYQIVMWTTGQTDWTRLGGSLSSSTTSYTHTGLTAGQTYYYRIRAVSDSTEGPWSEKVDATP